MHSLNPMQKLLIIDDDQAIRDVLTEAYSDDYNVRTSSGPDNIFLLLKDFEPDVILIEYNLHGKNGARICSSIKLNPETSHIPVILLSTIPEPNTEIRNCFCNIYIEKPFDLWALKEAIDISL